VISNRVALGEFPELKARAISANRSAQPWSRHSFTAFLRCASRGFADAAERELVVIADLSSTGCVTTTRQRKRAEGCTSINTYV
jgi:hypothetical protein